MFRFLSVELKKIRAEILSAVTICILIFLYMPLDTYAANYNDFSYDLYDLIKNMLPIAIICSVILVMLLCLLRKVLKQKYFYLFAICIGILLALYLQGSLFFKHLPILDGNEINWEQYREENIISIILFLAIILSSIILLHKQNRERYIQIVLKITGVILSLMIISLFILCIPTEIRVNKMKSTPSADGLFQMSKDENFVILLVDNLDASIFEIERNHHPEYEEALKDFTFFRNCVGLYPFTYYSIPAILTGEYYENKGDFFAFEAAAFESSPLFNTLESLNYRLAMYEAEMIPSTQSSIERFENVYPAERLSNPWGFIRMQIKFAGLRVLPYALKQYCVLTPENVVYNSAFTADDSKIEIFDDGNFYFYDKIINTEIQFCLEKKFSFIHIQGAHAPFVSDQGMNKIENGSYEDGIACSMTLIRAYLDKLKAENVYDNSVIMILGDHGYKHRQNPAVFIKGREEKTEKFKVNDWPVSYVDLQTVYLNLLCGLPAEEVFPDNDYTKSGRRYIHYFLADDGEMTEMLQTGYASDDSTLIETGNRYYFCK